MRESDRDFLSFLKCNKGYIKGFKIVMLKIVN